MIRGSHAWRMAEWGPSCRSSQLVTDYWIIGADRITCHKLVLPAFRALGRILRRHGYHVRSDVTGCYNCRKITGGTAMSAHAWGTAIDINWDTNPYRLDRLVTDMPLAMIRDIQALHTDDMSGPVFRWGGDWDGRPETPHSNYDAMHVELMVTPMELAAGFSVPAPLLGHLETYPLLARGEHGPAVEVVQRMIGTMPDGIFGPHTEQVVKDYQLARKLTADGVVGLATWTAVLTRMPALGGKESPPSKVTPI